ncbi:hypothetical protein [Jatrophihabitans sp.]|uniref:hypothetical protein n=1 Tax=Jatrophihabitans sp. TaxID=1932789 RepID=UPI002F002BFE
MISKDAQVAGPDGATVAGDLRRLQPVDGLFLRAEHLLAIETYAAALARAAGQARGTGIVYGFQTRISQDGRGLQVGPGAALDPTGRLLRSQATAQFDFADAPPLTSEQTGYWIVVISPAEWSEGSEKVYGSLCEDPCSGSAIQPWTEEGITVSLVPASLTGLAEATPEQRRNVLASGYFEHERETGEPWLTPPGVATGLSAEEWTGALAAPGSAVVPLALLQRYQGSYLLDVWAARREIGGAPESTGWLGHLAFRPWNVFLAQLLQFQDQLAQASDRSPRVRRRELVNPRDAVTTKFAESIKDKPISRWTDVKEFLADYWSTEAAHSMSVMAGSLLQQGFLELPPAGYLQVPDDPKGIQTAIAGYFDGAHLELRTRAVRADEVPALFEQARSTDRIPLLAEDPLPRVDILVPARPADLAALKTQAYGWVAFVRRRSTDQDPETPESEPVVVYEVTGQLAEVRRQAQAGRLPSDESRVGELTYPRGSWEYPGGDVALKLTLDGRRRLAALAVVSSEARRPLGALRATLFVASLDEGLDPVPVHASAVAQVPAEAIIIVHDRPDQADSDEVAVFEVSAALAQVQADAEAGRLPDQTSRVGVLRYQKGEWQDPSGLVAGMVHQDAPAAAIAVVRSADRLPLASKRVKQFLASPLVGLGAIPIHQYASGEAAEEAIIVVHDTAPIN